MHSSPSTVQEPSQNSSPTSEITKTLRDVRLLVPASAIHRQDTDQFQIASQEELVLAIESLIFIKGQQAERTARLDKIIKPIKQGLDELYKVRRDMNENYQVAITRITEEVDRYHTGRLLRTEPEDSTENGSPDFQISDVPPELPTGTHYRETWKAKVVDKNKLIRAVAAQQNGTSPELLSVNMREAHHLAKELHEELDRFDIGIQAVAERKLIVRTR